MRKKIFIAGGSGLLGVGLAVNLRNDYSVVLGIHQKGIILAGCESYIVEYSSPQLISSVLKRIKPDIVINAVALTDLLECEVNPEKANQINFEFAKNISISCQVDNIKLIHISTDQLTGGISKYMVENLTEPSDALNVYGKTKAAAENFIYSKYKKSLIIRTNFYGWGTSYRHSFSDFIISNLRNGNEITLYTDVFYTPILREQLIKEIMALCNSNAVGIFNLGSDERVSKYEFGLRIAKQFNLNIKLINPGLINQDGAIVKRPKDMSLSSQKINRTIPMLRTSMSEQIKLLFDQELNGSMREICEL